MKKTYEAPAISVREYYFQGLLATSPLTLDKKEEVPEGTPFNQSRDIWTRGKDGLAPWGKE